MWEPDVQVTMGLQIINNRWITGCSQAMLPLFNMHLRQISITTSSIDSHSGSLRRLYPRTPVDMLSLQVGHIAAGSPGYPTAVIAIQFREIRPFIAIQPFIYGCMWRRMYLPQGCSITIERTLVTENVLKQKSEHRIVSMSVCGQ